MFGGLKSSLRKLELREGISESQPAEEPEACGIVETPAVWKCTVEAQELQDCVWCDLQKFPKVGRVGVTKATESQPLKLGTCALIGRRDTEIVLRILRWGDDSRLTKGLQGHPKSL